MAVNTFEEVEGLKEVLFRNGIQEVDRINRTCPPEVLHEIAVRLDDWEMVGHCLGFQREKIRNIRLENDTQDLRKVALLDAWSRKEGRGATYLKLAQVLHRRQRSDLVDVLCEKYLEPSKDVSIGDRHHASKSHSIAVQPANN